MVGIDGGRGVGRRVILGPFFYPTADKGDLAGSQWRLAFGHRRLALVQSDLINEVTFVRLAGHDGRRAAFARSEQTLKDRHVQFAAGLRRLVAALAIGLQNWQDVGVVADGLYFSRSRLIAS